MPFNWEEYYNLAQDLTGHTQNTANEEARLRSAISRAYYAAYRSARTFLENEGSYNPGQHESSHLHVINRFKNSPNQTRKQIGNHLDSMRPRRNDADYEPNFPHSLQNTTQLILLAASQVLQHLQQI